MSKNSSIAAHARSCARCVATGVPPFSFRRPVAGAFSGNLLYAAIPQTIAGFGVILPYFTVARQGWIGGIVSAAVGWNVSRFRLPPQSFVDIACVYSLTVPLFFVASTFEFLSPWNV